MPEAVTFAGSCLCGAVRFHAQGPSLFCCHCHCRWCRKAHGAAFVTWFGVRAEGFVLDSGQEALRWFASSAPSRRGFCGACGTTLFYTSTLDPGEVHIARAVMDGPVDREPSLHIFTDHAVDWVRLGDDLPRYDSTARGLAKYQAVPALERG